MKLRSILALVLVMAMTFAMLPTFAAADDVAVETVAPVAEAPAVEDVAVISEAVPAEAPAAAPVGTIETVAAEAVPAVAELQALTKGAEFDSDDAALEAGYFLRLVAPNVGTAYYNSFQDASDDYCADKKAGTVLYLLCDYTYYSEASATAGIINCNANDNSASLSNLTFDLNGKTLTARCKRPVFARKDNCTNNISIRNGTILYQNLGETARRGIAYSTSSFATNNAGTSVMALTATFTDLTAICLEPLNGGYATPVYSACHWKGTVNVNNSTLVSLAGPAIEFKPTNGWKSDTKATQIAYVKKQGTQNCTVNLNGDCIVGSLTEAPAVQFNYPSTATDNELSLALNVVPANVNRTVFVGSAIANVANDPDDAARMLINLPAEYTEVGTVSLPLPDASTFFDESSAAEDVQPGWNEPAEFAAILAPACQHPNKTHVDAVPATYTETGTAEHWHCPDCDTYWEADGETVTTAAALVLPIEACPHAGKTYVDAVPSYAGHGVAAHWYCTDCGTYWEEDGVTETTLAALSTLPQLVEVDGRTDEELRALGAIAKVHAPDGTETAYGGLQAAFALSADWSEPGGVITLLDDYAIASTVVENSNPFLPVGNTYEYSTDSDPLVGTLYGFWFDLGGHTLSAYMGRPVIGCANAGSVNIRNGRIIHKNSKPGTSTSSGGWKGTVSLGRPAGSPVYESGGSYSLYKARVTLYNTEIIRVPGGTYADPISCSYWDNDVRLFDSKVIVTNTTASTNTCGMSFWKVDSNPAAGEGLEELGAHGFTVSVELHNSVLGNAGGTNPPIKLRSYGTNPKEYTDPVTQEVKEIPHFLTVSADTSSVFLGTSTYINSSGGTLTATLPEGDKITTVYNFTLPDETTLSETTQVGYVPSDLEAADYAAFYYAPHVHGTNATHHEAVAATAAEDGNIEYWECSCGNLFADEACTVPINPGDEILPRLTCAHPGLETHDEVPATFEKEGSIAYWYCPNCDRFFSDDECTVEIAESETVIPKLTDAAGKTDAELVELGAVAKTVAPDGAAKGFTTLPAAYTEAKTWTEAGGSLTLLTDITVENATNSWSAGYLSGINAAYDNNEVDGMPTKGFWLDLGGHTIDATLARAFVYSNSTSSINLRNGTILFTDNGRATSSGGSAAMYGAITLGTSTASALDGDGVKKININFYKLNFLVNAAYVKSKPAVVSGAVVNTTINVKESNVITAASTNCFKLYRTADTGSNDALVANGANYVVNITGGSTVGSTNRDSSAVYLSNYSSSVAFSEGVNYTLTVSADDDTVFLGYKPVGYAATAVAEGGYTVTENFSDFLSTRSTLTYPQMTPNTFDCTVWALPATLLSGGFLGETTDAGSAKATLICGAETAYFANVSDALAAAETLGAAAVPASVTLNAAATETYVLGSKGSTTAFSLNVNGQSLPEMGLFEADLAADATATVTMLDSGSAKLVAHVPAVSYAADDAVVFQKGSLLTKYSLNLAENVSINLYSDGENGDPDAVGYAQGGEEYVIAAPGEEHDWIVDTLAAKQMFEAIDAFAVKKSGSTIFVDYAKNVSVKGYADAAPAVYASDTNIADAMNAVLKTMLIYGKFAEKYFAGNYGDLSADELTAVGVAAIPETDTSNLEHADRVVIGMADYTADNTATSGFYGTSAVLEDAISMKFYFFGSEFAGKTATVNGEAAALEIEDDKYFVKTPISAKDFDKPITVEIAGVGSVTDSAEAYTARVGSGENEYKLAQALRAYGADAKRFAETKAGT